MLTVPTFPTCPNPGGTQKVAYPTGTHGIIGDSTAKSGSDSVFDIDLSRTVQCFCTDSASTGIQTNWWKVSSLSQDEITTLKNLGWTFVPNGSVWGLSSTPYMAKNITSSCHTTSTSLGVNNIGGSEVLGTSTEFAGTGGLGTIVLIFGIGLFFVGLSILLKSKKRAA